MVTLSRDAKNQIIQMLRSQGYATYARLLQLFDVYLTDDPDTVAYMIPQKAAIVINENVDQDSISLLVRHEILHEYLTHLERQLGVDKKRGINTSASTNEFANIAGDFEISNVGYTATDKKKAKNIMLGDKVLRGLVTELDSPGWENLTFEEMYEKLLDENKEELEQLKQLMQTFQDLNPESMSELDQQIQDVIDQMSGNSGRKSQSSSQGSEQGEESAIDGESSGTERLGKGAADEEGSTEKDLAKLRKAGQEVRQMQKTLDRMENDDQVFDDREDVITKIDIETRVRQIKDALQDIRIKNDLIGEVSRNKEVEKRAARAEKERRYARTGLRQFSISLLNFIRKEVEDVEDYTYAKINPVYARDGFIVPALGEIETPVPLINVYHDVSGSFSDPAKTEGALRAIESIQQYVRQGLIKVKMYYVTEVVRPYESGRRGGGGASGEAIIQHVKATKPDNVIVITDSDADDCTSSVTVPGAVWLLFYDAKAPSLISNLRGRKESRSYMIDYRRK